MQNEPGPDFEGYRFGIFELDVRAGDLRKQGRLVRLQGQPLQILAALLERPGGLVTREELRRLLWADDTFVDFEHSLNTAIRRLRETIGDTASKPRYIETLPRRGYRFTAPVERLGGGSAVAAVGNGHTGDAAGPIQPTARQPTAPEPTAAAPAEVEPHAGPPARVVFGGRLGRRPWPALVAAVVLGLAVVGVLLQPRLVAWRTASATEATPAPPAPGAPEAPRVAVLSFQNLTGDTARAYVAEGFTEELVGQLGRLAPGRLDVIARSSSASFKTPGAPLGEIARALGASYVIEGSVRSDGDRYRVAVRLVRAGDVTALWSELYEGALLDLMSIQRDVGQQVARRLAVTLLPTDRAALARATTSSSDAYEAYLHGVADMARGPGEGFARATQLFQQAVATDPRYALAYAGLAESYILQRDYYILAPEEAQRAAKAAALRAIAIDDGLAEAHCALAAVLSRTDGQTSAAEREFTQALALNPSHIPTRLRYAEHLARLGRTDEARQRLAQARILAPRTLDIVVQEAWMEFDAGRLDAAAALAAEALRFDPEFPPARYLLGLVALHRAAADEAVAQFERARVASNNTPKYVAALSGAYLAAGHPADAARTLDDLRRLARERYVPPGMIDTLAARLKSHAAHTSN